MAGTTGQTWLAKSRQRWKLIAFAAVAVPAWIVGMVHLNFRGSSELQPVGVLVTLLAVIWIFRAVRCELCGQKVLWTVVQKYRDPKWAQRVFAARDCPVCDGSGRALPGSVRAHPRSR